MPAKRKRSAQRREAVRRPADGDFAMNDDLTYFLLSLLKRVFVFAFMLSPESRRLNGALREFLEAAELRASIVKERSAAEWWSATE
jgi:hypothetical protein